MGELDLDAARAARDEARGEGHWLKFGGETFELPAEMPWDYFEILETGDMKAALGELLNGDFDRFWAHKPTIGDMTLMASSVPALYGFGKGNPESPASGGSSAPTGSPSRPTSPAGTRSTSAKRSTARRRSG